MVAGLQLIALRGPGGELQRADGLAAGAEADPGAQMTDDLYHAIAACYRHEVDHIDGEPHEAHMHTAAGLEQKSLISREPPPSHQATKSPEKVIRDLHPNAAVRPSRPMQPYFSHQSSSSFIQQIDNNSNT